ncbi:hypothetical protein ACPA9J_05135 [Pseudomonas aeruginosa]
MLGEIGANELPMLEVYNKVDLLPSVEPHIQRDDSGKPVRVWLSAQTGEGLDLLRQAIAEAARRGPVRRNLASAPAAPGACAPSCSNWARCSPGAR